MKTKTFIIHYPFEGRKCGLEIKAKNWDEARRKLNALQYGEVSGEVKYTLRGPTLALLPFWMMFCSFKNRFKKST